MTPSSGSDLRDNREKVEEKGRREGKKERGQRERARERKGGREGHRITRASLSDCIPHTFDRALSLRSGVSVCVYTLQSVQLAR